MQKEAKINSEYEESGAMASDPATLPSKREESPIYNFDWFPITTSPWIAAISFVLPLFFVVHSIDFYSDMADKVFDIEQSSFKLLSGFITTSSNLTSVALVFMILLFLACILAFLYNKFEEEEGYRYLLGWVGNKLFPFLRYLIDANIVVGAIFMPKNPLVGILFIVAVALNITINFFCQNYSLRKDYLCCKSVEYLLLWKISIIIGFTINCASYYLVGNSQRNLLIVLIIQFIIFFSILILYFAFGYLIYRHSSSQLFLIFSLNTYCGITMGNMYDAIEVLISGEFIPNRNLILSVCFFSALCVMSYCSWTKIKKEGSSMDNINPIKKIFFLFNKLENSSENISDDCEIRGIIRYHLTHLCPNENCFINQNKSSFYDSKKNSSCFVNKINQGKTSFVKFMAKCAYEQELENQKWNNTDLLLDYIEFYFMKLKNLFKVSIILAELEKKFLTPFQRIRLVRLRRIMLEENRKLNEELYHGNLDLENLIASENKFDEIQLQLKEMLNKNIELWKYLGNDSINLSIMVSMIRPNFELVEKINNNWKTIAKYFEIQKVWKFLFVCYTLYVRNEKIKPQLLEEFGQSVHEDELFSQESVYIDKTTEESRLFISKMIFEQDVCCIHINHSQDKPIIKSVSRYFERIFGYQNSEIVESSLEIMMTPCFREVHRQKFLAWAGEGKSNKENNYEVKKIFPIDKEGHVVCAFKFYKQFLSINRELQYVAMLKTNKEEENVIILNDNYEIEGMTQSLVEKFGFSVKDYQEIIGVNLLIFLPGLIEYTKFDEFKQSHGKNLADYFETSVRTSNDGKQKKGEISTKKEFTKNNITLGFPHYLENAKETYLEWRKKGENMSEIFEGICQGLSILKDVEVKQKFKVEIEVRQVQLEENNTYIEFYLREIEYLYRDGSRNDGRMDQSKQKFDTYEDSINESDLNKFFENSQNSENISLSFNNNLFIKEDNNEPVTMISHVKSISLFVRIIFFMFFILLITSFVIEFIHYSKYRENSLIMESIINMQLKMMTLANKYHSQAANITGSVQTIEEITNDLRDIRENNLEFKKGMLETSINPKAVYEIPNGYQSEISVYDQIDIIDKMYEIMMQVVYTQGGDSTLNNFTFLSFKEILPYMERMTTNSINRVSDKFNEIFSVMENKNSAFIGISILFICLGFLLVLSSLFKITKSFVSLMEIFTQFSEIDLKKIIKYSHFLELMFNHLYKKYDQFKDDDKGIGSKSREHQPVKYESNQNSQPTSGSGLKITHTPDSVNDDKSELDNANLNKKVKKVENGKELRNLKLKSVGLVIIFLVLYGLATFALNLYISIMNKGVVEFKETGYEVFTYYSTVNMYMLAYKDKNILKENFNITKYAPFFKRMDELKKLTRRSPGTLNYEFVKLRNNILFGNVCEIYPEVLTLIKHTVSECEFVAFQNLLYGTMSFIFYEAYNVEYFLNGTSYVLDPILSSELELGLEIVNTYFSFMLKEWASGFEKMYWKLRTRVIIVSVCVFLFQAIVYILLIEVFIVSNLKKQYLFFKKIYNNLIPDFIVTKEKIIKAKLEVEGFISK